MWLFYILSIIPLIIGGYLWCTNKNVIWWEWLLSFTVAITLSIIFHIISIVGMTNDYETWSGQITKVTFYPKWVEEYTTTDTHTDSKGHTHTTTSTHYRTHHEYWMAYSSINTERKIEYPKYLEIHEKFGSTIETNQPFKSGFYSGDRNTYTTNNQTKYVFPINEWFSFENRVKAAPTLFNFAKPPTNAQIYEYPQNKNWFISDRLIGTANQYIDKLTFDRLNSKIGPYTKCNLIIIGFPPNTPPITGQYQQAKWIGGKKNDLIICYAGGNQQQNPEWVYVFGWTEKDIVKQNLQTILLERPINNQILPLIEEEIKTNYTIKNWKKFDYITIQPPTWSYIIYIILVAATQIGYWIWALQNEHTKTLAYQILNKWK